MIIFFFQQVVNQLGRMEVLWLQAECVAVAYITFSCPIWIVRRVCGEMQIAMGRGWRVESGVAPRGVV